MKVLGQKIVLAIAVAKLAASNELSFWATLPASSFK
jgi:hypothetical protein